MGPGSVRRGKVRPYNTTNILWIRKIYLDLWIKSPGRSDLCMILSICFIISPINLNWNMDKSLQICYLYALHWISDLIWDFRLVSLIELKSRSPWVPCNRQRRLKQKITADWHERFWPQQLQNSSKNIILWLYSPSCYQVVR